MSLVGKLTVPKHLAGRALGRKTMQDDDGIGQHAPIVIPAGVIIEEDDSGWLLMENSGNILLE